MCKYVGVDWAGKRWVVVSITDESIDVGTQPSIQGVWDVEFEQESESSRGRIVTDGGARMAPSMTGDGDELLHVPDRFRRGGEVRGKPIKRARLVEVETAHPGPDRQVLELHTEDGAAYRFQRYGSSADFSWLHWQYPGRDPRENHGGIEYAVQVYVGLVNGEGLDRFREDIRTMMAIGGWSSYSAIEPYLDEPTEGRIGSVMRAAD